MSAATTQCPDREKLQAFVLRKVSDSDARRLSEHTVNCPHCQSIIRTLKADNVGTTPIGTRDFRVSSKYPFLEPAQDADEIGRLGNYRVISLLGEGGMGYVFLAEDLTLGRPAALKVMKPETTESLTQERSKRFIKEAQALAKMKHENLVPVYNAGTSGDTVFYAMELLEGESLRDRLEREAILHIDEILRLGKELSSGLAFIHMQGLIHRDIKPANIWLEAPDGRVKILDLGLVRNVNEDIALTRSGIVVGSLGFMSPEQARGQPMDARTDLFSLGCVLYRLCTGVGAFEGSSTMAVLTALATETPRPAIELNPNLPPGLSKLVMQLLAKDPKDRPASAEEVRERLERINQRMQTSLAPKLTDGIQAKAPPPKPKKKSKIAKKMEQRRTKIVVGVGLGVIAVCTGIVVMIALTRGGPGRGPGKDDKPPFADKGPLGDRVFLKNMTPFAMVNFPKVGMWPYKDGTQPGATIWNGGVEYKFGIFMHPAHPDDDKPASVSYKLDKKFRTFKTAVSLDDRSPPPGLKKDKGPKGGPKFGPPEGCEFAVYGDDRNLWTSRPIMSAADVQESPPIDVKDVDILKLEVTTSFGPPGHAVWLDPFVSK